MGGLIYFGVRARLGRCVVWEGIGLNVGDIFLEEVLLIGTSVDEIVQIHDFGWGWVTVEFGLLYDGGGG